MTKARICGPSAMPSGDGWSRSNRTNRLSIIDSKALGLFMPSVFRPSRAPQSRELAASLGLPCDALEATVRRFNAACTPGTFDHTRARRLPHARAYAGKDALGARSRHAAVLRLSASARHHVHLSWRQSESKRRSTDRARACSERARGRRDHGWQHFGERLSGRDRDDDRHRVWTHCRKGGCTPCRTLRLTRRCVKARAS